MHIARNLKSELESWTSDAHRKVLLLRGPRQVGKTYLIRNHAKTHYKYLLEVNFISDKRIRQLFESDIDLASLCESLHAYYNIPIIPEETLLFFDEIQSCIPAIEALRFFHEKRPDLHVIASGSLLEFALEDLSSFGAGRIQSLFLHPVAFDEFLIASNEEPLLEALRKAGPDKPLPVAIHEKLMARWRTFAFTGGMPEVVNRFLTTRDLHAVPRWLDEIRLTLEDDFVKYRRRVPETRLREVFRSVAAQAGRKFVHSHAYPDAAVRHVHSALELLVKAGIVHRVYHSSANGILLGAEASEKKFKTIPFDHGLYQTSIGLSPAEVVSRDFDPINKGALAEVCVGTALIAATPPWRPAELYYWHRESKSSNAEVDYIIQIDSMILPVEVKSSGKGTMQSMQAFLSAKNSPFGVRIAGENFARTGQILVIPIYAAGELTRIISSLKTGT